MASKNASFKIILGSSSMARRQILSEMGYEFTVMSADIDEKSIRREKPEELVMALAEAKADAIFPRLRNTRNVEENEHPTLLITADTDVGNECAFGDTSGKRMLKDMVVVFEGSIREKPSSKEEAREYIKGYSSSHTEVVGSVIVTNLTTGKKAGGFDRAEVYFHEIPEDVIDNLIEEGIILNVAGGLMLEHPLTLPFVDTVVGTADSVMGLSKALTEKLIQEAL